MKKITLNGNDDFDGIVEKIIIENNKKRTTITIKQWNFNGTNTYMLSVLEFNNVIFQSLPDISSFNLVREITHRRNTKAVLLELNEYLNDNPTLVLHSTEDNISNEISNESIVQSYFFRSGYCKDWLIICSEMNKKEFEVAKD